MSELPNQEIEGRLNVQREVLTYVIAHIVRLERDGSPPADGLLEALEVHMQYQDSQEDPGAVPSGPAFAIEGAMMREFDLIVREVRARLGEIEDRRA